MLNRISLRVLFCKNNAINSAIRINRICVLHHRTIHTNRAQFNIENDLSPVKIYHGVLSNQIKAVKVFSLGSSIIGLMAQPILYKEILSTGSVPIIVAAYSFVGFFTLITPVLLHQITKKYVTSMEYVADEDKYIAHTINFFCMSKTVEFKVDDVEVPEIPGMFTTIKVKGKPIFLDLSHFENPDHYAILMGYNKPMDFKLGDPNTLNKIGKQ